MDDFEIKLPSFKFKIPTKRSFSGKKRVWRILGFIVLGLVGIFLIYQLFRYFSNAPVYSALTNTKNFTPKEIAKDSTLATINQIIELPNDQNGTYGKIKDNNALIQRKDFFKKSRNGDVLVIYSNMTIIYDPENHSVVDVAKANLLQ